MIFKKQFLLLSLFLIIIIQTLLYTSNNQKTSFRYFKWTLKEVSIGKLIGISFFSGLSISTLLSATVTGFKKNNLKNAEENFETLNEEEEVKSNIEMPPQRDVRDSQPTISVNYRVVKNIEKDNLNSDQNFSNNSDRRDDWNSNDNEW